MPIVLLPILKEMCLPAVILQPHDKAWSAPLLFNHHNVLHAVFAQDVRRPFISVVDMSGKIILQRAYSDGKLFSLAISDKPDGVYIFQVAHEEGTSTIKIVKQ